MEATQFSHDELRHVTEWHGCQQRHSLGPADPTTVVVARCGPTISSRLIALFNQAQYDTWAAFDPKAWGFTVDLHARAFRLHGLNSSSELAAASMAQAATGVPITPYDPLYKNITGLWLFLFFLLGVASFQRVVENFTGHSAFAVGFTLLAVLGTNLVHYIAKEPSMGHATVFTLTSIATRILLELKP